MQVKRPKGFDLYYSIYHPLILMTCRTCLFFGITGCYKQMMDESCLPECKKSATITNLNGIRFQVEKSSGNYNVIYHSENMLNTGIVSDLPELFSGFMVDLRDVNSATKMASGKKEIAEIFKQCLNRIPEAAETLVQKICPTVNSQYIQGI